MTTSKLHTLSMALAMITTGAWAQNTTPTTPTAPSAPAGVTVSIQTPTFEVSVPSVWTAPPVATGVATVTAPSLPVTFAVGNGTGSDIPVVFASATKRIIVSLHNATGAEVWNSAAGDTPAPTPGVLTKGLQLREVVSIPLIGADGKGRAAGVYTIEAVLNADKGFSAQTTVNITQVVVPRNDTGARGTVVKSETTSGGTTTDVGVKAYVYFSEVVPAGTPRAAYVRSVLTGDNGTYTATGFFAGTYRVYASPAPGVTGLQGSLTSTITIADGAITDVPVLRLISGPNATAGVSGTVVKSVNGADVGTKANVYVYEVPAANATRPAFSKMVVTNDAGAFSATGFYPGSYRAYAYPVTTTVGVGSSPTVNITIADGAITPVPTLKLATIPRSDTGASGSIVKAGSNAADVGVQAYIYFRQNPPAGTTPTGTTAAGSTTATTTTFGLTVQSDATGAFTAKGLYPGSYTVYAYPVAGTIGLTSSESRTVTITEGSILPIGSFKLRPIALPTTGVSGTVVSLEATSEVPAGGANVTLTEQNPPAGRTAYKFGAYTSPDGKFVTGTPPGTYAIGVTKIFATTSANTATGTTIPASTVITLTGTGTATVVNGALTAVKITLTKAP